MWVNGVWTGGRNRRKAAVPPAKAELYRGMLEAVEMAEEAAMTELEQFGCIEGGFGESRPLNDAEMAAYRDCVG